MQRSTMFVNNSAINNNTSATARVIYSVSTLSIGSQTDILYAWAHEENTAE